MTISTKYFYPFTQQFSNVVGDVTSFIWASYAGLWHVHSTGKTLAGLSTNPDWKKIEGHLGTGAPDQRGFDIQKISEKDWRYHQDQFSYFILTQAAILYEEWCQSLVCYIKTNKTKGPPIKSESFQFPSSHSSSKFLNWSALDKAGVIQESSFLKNQIQPALIKKYTTNIDNIDQLLCWYRYFKGIRNSIVHHGGIAQQSNEIDYKKAAATKLVDIGIKRNYSGPAPVAGQKIVISLSDAVLFLGIIIRIAYGFDAKYCHTISSELLVIDKIRDALKQYPPPTNVKESRKNSWIKNFLIVNIYIDPIDFKEAEIWLKSEGLIDIKVF